MSKEPPLLQGRQHQKQLATCTCCPSVKELGGGYKDFLILADQLLSDGAGGGNYLNVSETKMFPPEIRYMNFDQRGINGEYTVFYGLHDSKIPMYVFHGLMSITSKKEMSDFIIVSDRVAVALEVKTFVLVEDPKDKNIDAFHDVLHKSFKQQARLRQDVKKFLEAHNCKVSSDDELPLTTFTLFPFATDRAHNVKNIKADFEDILKQDKDIDYFTACNFRDRLLFGDEYITKLQEIIKENIVDNEEREFQLRTLLAWFYGTYSYEELCSKNQDDEELHAVSRMVNEASKKCKKRVSGIFLSEEQFEVVDCKQSYLAIVGYPGTGKTYCLLAKLIRDIKEKMKNKKKKEDEVKSQTQMIGGGTQERDEKILFIHLQKSTLKHIENLFLKSLKQQHFDIEFLTEEELRSKLATLKNSKCRLRVFFDDYPNTNDSASLLRSLAEKIDFLWYSCYSMIPWFDPVPRPFSRLKVDGDCIFDNGKYAFLNKTLRFTAHIHSLANCIFDFLPENMPGYRSELTEYYHGPRKTTSVSYICGTRVVGAKVKFVEVDDLDEENLDEENLDKVVQVILRELPEQMNTFAPKNILVAAGYRVCSKVLELINGDRYREITVAHPMEVRGQEKECVIVVVEELHLSTKENPTLQTMLDACTRAISKLVVIYSRVCSLPEIVERNEKGIPKIPSLKAGNKQPSVIKEIDPLIITQLLGGKCAPFRDFSLNLHGMQEPCVTEEEKRNGFAWYCSLSCTDRALNEISTIKDPSSFLLLKKACYFVLLIEEICECGLRMLSDSFSDLVSEKFQERQNYLLGVLLKWMRGIEEEPGMKTGAFSFIQYRQVILAFRQNIRKEIFCEVGGKGNKTLYFRFRPETEETKRLVHEIKKLCSLYDKTEKPKQRGNLKQ